MTKPRLSDIEVDERATEAVFLLEHPLLQECMDNIYSRYIVQLQNADINTLTAATAHAMIKAVSELRSELTAVLTEQKLRSKHNRGRPNG